MRILGIETSCDETAASVVEDGRRVRSNVIATAASTSPNLAGVIPEEVARKQLECIVPIINQALMEATMDWTDIDAIAVTRGPGLLGSLLVGTAAARMLASVHALPLIGVHHTLGHLSSTWLLGNNQADVEPAFPVLSLSVSGGHTDLWYRSSHITGQLLGRTRDDAAGEAFDKGASMLGLPFPGGPSIAKAANGDERRHAFPRPLHGDDSLDFSFSGLKTSLKYLLRDEPDAAMSDVAASFQHAICRHLTDRLQKALDRHPEAKEVHVVGGVSANERLRRLCAELCDAHPSRPVFRTPASLRYCTDNAAMIAAAGYFTAQALGMERASAAFSTEASLALDNTIKLPMPAATPPAR